MEDGRRKTAMQKLQRKKLHAAVAGNPGYGRVV
jgi:hypothetical protein